MLGHHYLLVVLTQDLELDYLTIKPPQALQGQLAGLEDLDLWAIDA